jgi:hypothetical protein
VLSSFVLHLALYQAFENQLTLAGLNPRGLTLPPGRDCYERMVCYCLDTNWGKQMRAATS